MKAPGEGRSVIVVDAEGAQRRFASQTLEAAGYAVRQVSTAGEALTLLADEKSLCDLVLTDLWLGPMSGPDLAAIARRMRPGLKVLYMTSDPSLFAAASRPSAGIVAKPFMPQELLAAVAFSLAERRPPDEEDS